LPFWRRFRVTSLSIDFVNQNVATITLFDDAFARSSITRYDDSSVGALKPIAKRASPPLAMFHVEGCNSKVAVLIDDSRGDLVRIDAIAVGAHDVPLTRPRANLDVVSPRREHVISHCFDARRAVDLKRQLPANNPGREYKIRVPDRVIGVQMCHERV